MVFLKGMFASTDARTELRTINRYAEVILAAFVGLAALCGAASAAERNFGGFGPEGPRMREQLWILPSGEEGRSLRATLFRPEQDPKAPNKQFPLVVIKREKE